MLAIAFESLLKLLAFVAVGVFACLHLRGRPGCCRRNWRQARRCSTAMR
jgi:hypothetical protein